MLTDTGPRLEARFNGHGLYKKKPATGAPVAGLTVWEETPKGGPRNEMSPSQRMNLVQ